MKTNKKDQLEKATDLMLEIAKIQEEKQLPPPEQPKTSYDQIRESSGKLISGLVCIGFLVVVLLFIIGSCAS